MYVHMYVYIYTCICTARAVSIFENVHILDALAISAPFPGVNKQI